MKLTADARKDQRIGPAAFRRLCVETEHELGQKLKASPAAFRRLCVETMWVLKALALASSSRLQAAVC